MTRYPPIPIEDMYFEQRRVALAVGHRRKKSVSSGGGLEGPFLPLAYVPGILDHLQMLGEYCRFATSLTPKLRELAIIVTARHVSAQIEFYVHAMEAREFGFAEENISAIAEKRPPPSLDADEALVFEFCTEMFATGRVSEAMFDRAADRFGRAAIIDLLATCGYYKTLGLVLNVSQATAPPFLGEVVMPFPVDAD